MQVTASQKQAKGKAEGNGALLCICVAACWKGKLPHVTACFVWFCFALFVGMELSHVYHGLLCFARGKMKLSHVTVCFVMLCFGSFSFARAKGKLSNVTNCFALLCFASLCIALQSFALHCSFEE